MGKKMKLPFVSQSKSVDSKKLNSYSTCSSSSSSSSQWGFPSCGNLKTHSYRAKDNDAFITFNSAYLDTEMTASSVSFFTVSSSSQSFSTMSEDIGDPAEPVLRGLRSDRLFFEPDQSCSLVVSEPEDEEQAQPEHQQQQEEEGEEEEGWSLVEDMGVESDEKKTILYKESEVLSMDSNEPYEDFRRSMEEMVEAHGFKDWQGLEELLGCYLKINAKNTHACIMAAFIDLLVTLSFPNTSSTTRTTTTTTTSTNTTTTLPTNSSSSSSSSSPSSPLSPSSSLTTPCLSSLLDHDDDDHDNNHHGHEMMMVDEHH